MVHALAVIPARYASQRLPGKPLLDRTGKPLIRHVVENAQRAKRIGRVVVATDDQRIYDAVKNFGGEAVMTGEHPNGTSRIAEAILKSEIRNPTFEIILNIQGDEPEIDPACIDTLIDTLAHADTPMATLAAPFAPDEDPANPNIVKVVLDHNHRALYFSRAPIPHIRDAEHPPSAIRHPPFLKHLGIYAYRRDFLAAYVKLGPTPLEQAEKLEQLRALEHGHAIAVAMVDAPHPGIDTPQQYDAFVARVASR